MTYTLSESFVLNLLGGLGGRQGELFAGMHVAGRNGRIAPAHQSKRATLAETGDAVVRTTLLIQ